MSTNKISRIEISLASPQAILEWSHGEVTKPETINYKTQKPEADGLFDERIFGPVKDYECACGKYKKVKNKGKKCEKCGVEITESVVRRERMGHIELAAPVAHTWMIKELPFPSKISLVLNISYKEVEQVVYFVNYIVLQEGTGKYADFFNKKEVIDLSNSKAAKSSRGVLRKLLRQLRDEDLKKGSVDYTRARIYYERLKDSNLPFSFDEVTGFIGKHTGLRFGIGAEAIYELLKEVDLEKEYKEIRQELKDVGTTEDDRAKKLLRRLEVIKWLKGSTNKPEWMIMTRIPVTPPDTRPIIQLDGGRFTTSDINNLYRRIIIRNERLKKIIADRSPSIIVNNEKRMLQEAVDALFDNASRRKPIVGKDRRPLKSLTDYLKGKQGRFRQNLLGKRVDYSGRSVITVGPELKIYQCGLPAEMILKLFKPFIIHELIARDPNAPEQLPAAANIKTAEAMIQTLDARVWPVVEKVIAQRPVLLNRAPTLHRLGIQAFEVKMTDGKSIRLHPLVTPAFNADFDGDQMAVHVPLSDEAVAEARSIMLASWNVMGPKDGKPIITPTQDMVLGNYYLTTETKGAIGEGMQFSSVGEAVLAYENDLAHPHAIVAIATSAYPKKKFAKDGMIITTMGKIILNSVLPDEAIFINGTLNLNKHNVVQIISRGESVQEAITNHQTRPAFGKKDLAKLIEYLFQNFDIAILPKTMDAIKDLGFKFSTRSGITVSAFDVPAYNEKYKYFEEADAKVEELRTFFKKGLLTDDERYSRVVKVWDDVRETVSADIKKLIARPELKSNPIVIMSDSGARGNLSNFTQLSGMRGLMSKSYNYDQNRGSKVIKDTIETPIKHSFIEGLTVSEYFNSSFGARKGMSDTAMKTSKAGYMTRKLVDATQEVVVRELDCGATKGIVVSDIVDTKTNTIIEKFVDRITDRYSVAEVLHPKTKQPLVRPGDLITAELANEIVEAGIESLELRSVLHCRNHISVCQKCFGLDLTTRKPIAIGTTIGVIAAQSIGEPGTQLTMRTFHTGGVAGGSNIAQGFERLKQLLDVVTPKPHELAVISEINGKVIALEMNETRRIVVQSDMESREYTADVNSILRVKLNDEVQAGDKLTDGSIDVKKLLLVAGIESVRQYLIKEIQRVYRLQGIEISDKYIEVIIRQLTSKQIVQEPGASKLFTGQVIDANELREINKKLMEAGKAPASAISTIFGLDEAPSKSDSFLSAASFQDTKKILIDAAVRGQVDGLYGLKENVILGNIINAGSGLLDPEELKVMGERARKLEY